MAARKIVAPKPTPSEPPRIFRSSQEIDIAIAKLRQRIEELERLDIAAAAVNNTGADIAVQSRIRTAILEVFGLNSPEYQEHQHVGIWAGGVYQNMATREIIDVMKGGRTRVIGTLEELVRRLEEKRADLNSGAGANRFEEKPSYSAAASVAASTDFGQHLHPRIRDVARQPLLDGHYWEGISEGAGALMDYVKERSGRHDLDGALLVRLVFSPPNPVLALNGLATEIERDEQEGMMRLFEGAVLTIRNPRAARFFDGSAQRAIEYISLLSLLAYRLEGTTRKISR